MIPALYEDEDILVLDKPAGLATQPGAEVRVSLVEAVERDYGFHPYLVHRLDKETAGCIIVARTAGAATRWTSLVASRSVGKFYRAIVAGVPAAPQGRFADPVPVRGAEKSAETGYRVLGRFGRAAGGAGFSYLELELGTGRTHQIRLHLARAGLPILGDDRHGDFALNKRLKKEYGLKRLLLVAWRLELPGGRAARAALPEHMATFLAAFPDAPAAELP